MSGSVLTGAARDGRAAEYDVVVVGAGFAGLYSLYRLRNRGLKVLVIEAGSDVGGTWFWNRYPGARCDVESLDYSYSFSAELEQEWDWSEKYATQPEILSYIHHVADEFDLRKDVLLSTRVVSAHFDDARTVWSITTDSGRTVEATYCIMATGCLSVPREPQMAGLDDFVGEKYHTGRWPEHPVSFAGKRVGVIGTGSSGTQLIPVVAKTAGELFVFLRTPNFSVPAHNAPLDPDYVASVKGNYRARREYTRSTATGLSTDMNRVSALAVSDEEREAVYERGWDKAGFGFILSFQDLLSDRAANDTAVEFLHRKSRALIDDPEIARKLTATDYPFGSKRPCVDTDFFVTFNRPNVHLVDVREHPIRSISATGVETDAESYDLDMIVFATGFDAMTGALSSIDIRGVGGQALADRWKNGPMSYLGLAVSGFPNLLTITGPGSPSVLTNVMVSIEQHVEWIDTFLAYLERNGIRRFEADPTAEADWTEHVNDAAYSTLYPIGNSWYLGPERDDGGRRSFMPYVGGLRAYRRKCDAVAEAGYEGFSLEGSSLPAQLGSQP